MSDSASDSVLSKTGHSKSVTPPAVPDSTGTAATSPKPIVTPLTYGDALDLAEAAIGDGDDLRTGRGVLMRHRIAFALMAVDCASRTQEREGSADLLGDVLDFLTEVSEYANAEADVVDGPGGEDGADVLPNRAMKFQTALDDNYGGRGLITRVREAWQQAGR